MLKRSFRVLMLASVACLATACFHSFARVQTTPLLQSKQSTLNRVAVLPFSEGSSVPHGQSIGVLVARYMAEALVAQGFQVIPASDVQNVLADTSVPVEEISQRLQEKFGVDSILTGEVQHYEVLKGSAAGATKPARVGFRTTLYRAQDAEKLLDAAFDERQVALSENLLVATRYPGGGSYWLSAEELARWGSEKVAKALSKIRKEQAK